jgi:hypothetical protein
MICPAHELRGLLELSQKKSAGVAKKWEVSNLIVRNVNFGDVKMAFRGMDDSARHRTLK